MLSSRLVVREVACDLSGGAPLGFLRVSAYLTLEPKDSLANSLIARFITARSSSG